MDNQKIKDAAEVMLAAANGEKIQWKTVHGGDWMDVTDNDKIIWNLEIFVFRVAPKFKFVPWTLDTVPRELLWVRPIGGNNRSLITTMGSNNLRFANSDFEATWQRLLYSYEWLRPDGVWSPCGQGLLK